jgi:MFS transporter, SP family, xylose:H+ symportor
MVIKDFPSKTNSSTPDAKGKTAYILALTLVATLGGLLFGYDTAVVNGAEKSLVEFYISRILDPAFKDYAIHVIFQYKIFVGVVFYIIALIISAQLFRLFGSAKKGTVASVVILGAVTIWAIIYYSKPLPLTADTL